MTPAPSDPEDPITNQGRSASEDEANESASEEEEPEAPEDLMVVSRARRSNAGNRMSTLLAQTVEEEQWGEDWEEAANEEEFVGDDAEDQGDFNLESSESEDEDDRGDEDAGEKELRKAERQERTKKRKAGTNPFAARIAAAARKKVKLDVPATTPTETTPAPRPKKKSERASWIPTPEDGPTRMSSRRQTVISKEDTLARLKKKDKKREDTLAMMKAAEERKQKDKPKPMTQEERLAEARKVEKQNSKSLHRWEEAEEKRAAERQAKLDALKNRELEGPFIRYYSGPVIWVDEKIKYVGKECPSVEEVDQKVNSKLAAAESSEIKTEPAVDGQPQPHQESPEATQQASQPSQPIQATPAAQGAESQGSQQDSPNGSHAMAYPSTIMFAPPQTSDSFLFGIEQYASMQIEPSAHPNPYPLANQNATTPQSQPTQPPLPQPTQSQPQSQPQPDAPQPPQPPQPPETQPSQPSQPPYSQSHPSQPSLPPQPPTPPKKKHVSLTAHTFLTLTSFPSLPPTLPPAPLRATLTSVPREKYRPTLSAISQILFHWSPADANLFATIHSSKYQTKNSSLPVPEKQRCVVSGRVARYRDPKTGLAYWGRRELKRVRGLVGGGMRWSAFGMLVSGKAAKGVPAGFLGKRKGDGEGEPSGSGKDKVEGSAGGGGAGGAVAANVAAASGDGSKAETPIVL